MIMKEDARALLPRVGDKLKKAPTVVQPRGLVQSMEPQDCEVVEVSQRGLWYRVRFLSGATECYKVPEDSAPEPETTKSKKGGRRK